MMLLGVTFWWVRQHPLEVVPQPLLPERQDLEVGGEGGDDLLGHLVDAGQAEAGLDEGGVGGEPVPDRGDRPEERPPPSREGLPLLRVYLRGGEKGGNE